MIQVSDKVRGMITLGFFLVMLGSLIILTILKAESSLKMALRWVSTGVLLAAILLYMSPLLGLIAMLGFLFIWRQALTGLVAKPFMSLYDGGSTAPDPHPHYSVARARQKQGRYHESIQEIDAELEKFPNDLEGQLLKAEIQAENLKDLSAAETTIDSLCAQARHSPKNLAFALYSMADWHLKIGRNANSARRYLDQIIELFPNTEFAAGAAHRVAHLATTELLMAHEHKKFTVATGSQRLGLESRPMGAQPPSEGEPGQLAAQYVKHLEEHPLDAEIREKLAVLYADHFKRLDLASDQLEQLIDQPEQPTRLVAHWLNLLADLQIRSGMEYETVVQTLQRIIDRTPELGVAQVARSRLAHLKLEFKGREKNRAVKMGSYEQNLGLKGTSPRRGEF
jgi:tetratricopeptide (TPR) repeat protein